VKRPDRLKAPRDAKAGNSVRRTPVISSPLNQTSPLSGAAKPVMMLTAVLLPEPFNPIIPRFHSAPRKAQMTQRFDAAKLFDTSRQQIFPFRFERLERLERFEPFRS
jgi:hypothetical protein